MRQKGAMALGICFTALLGGMLQNGCNHSPAETTGPVQFISGSGIATLKDQTPVTQQMQYRITLGGSNLFKPGANGCRHTDPHAPAQASVTIRPDLTGHFESTVDLRTAHSLADPGCTLATAAPDQLTSLRIDASIPATEETCPAFCSAESAADLSACVSDCQAGNRIVLATRTFAPSDLPQLRDAPGTLRLKLNLSLERLGPRLSDGSGPDLAVSASAARDTLHITEEDFAPDDCAMVEACIRGPGTRRLLRFDGDILNLGTAPLELGSPVDNPLFEFSPCHGHYHLRDMMLYELLSENSAPVVVASQRLAGHKQGFCMMDSYPSNDTSPSNDYSCDDQGLSPGWADSYDSALDCQWVDITGVPPGNYRLRITANPVSSEGSE